MIEKQGKGGSEAQLAEKADKETEAADQDFQHVNEGDSYYVPPNAGLMSPDFIKEPAPIPSITDVLEPDLETTFGQELYGEHGVSHVKGIEEWLPDKMLN